MEAQYQVISSGTPVISTAIHDGHFIAADLRPFMLLDEAQRFREEDPYTCYMAELPTSRVIVHSSRFQSDFNRPPEQSVYTRPEDAWGLKVWRDDFPDILRKELMVYYEGFYKKLRTLIEETLKQFGRAIILDIHSYNHRREGPYTSAPSVSHPEINLGTAYNQPVWKPLCKIMKSYLSHCIIAKHNPDVRENIIFKGGWLSQWAIKNYGERLCVFSIECKKTFMDEWTGRGDWGHIRDIQNALSGSLPMLIAEMKSLKIN